MTVASISESDRPRCLRSLRRRLFSSTTRLAAVWISAEAATPAISHSRYLDSSSCRYSLRRARDRRWLSRMRARLEAFYARHQLQAASRGNHAVVRT